MASGSITPDPHLPGLDDPANEAYSQVWYGAIALAITSTLAIIAYVCWCGWTLAEAVYMVVITVSTVGYGEIGHASPESRWVSSFVIVFGISSVGYMVGGLFRLMAEGEIRRLISQRLQTRMLDKLGDHHIICGFGRMGAMICQQLQQKSQAFVLVEQDSVRVQLAEQAGYAYVLGDATEDATLVRAGVQRARSLVCVLPSDADNVFVTLTARNMSPKLFIAARAEQPSTERKLRQAGADRVVAPQVIGAHRIASLLTQPTTVEILELVTGRRSVDLEMDEMRLPAQSALHGQSLSEAAIRQKTRVIVVAIKRADGSLLVNPDSHTQLFSGDIMVVLGRQEDVAKFREIYAV